MAVAAYAWDGEPPPPELSRALNYRAWGVSDVMQLPAGLLPRMNTSIACYNALSSYKSAGIAKLPWIEKNPQAWDIVTRVMNMRKQQRD